MNGGLSQILFVSNGRATKEEREIYKLLTSTIFDDELSKYVTIVKTNFPSFLKTEKCRDDKQKMIENGGELGEMIRSCNEVIHVDNPVVSTEEIDDDEELRINKSKRSKSRGKLVDYLNSNCQEIYESETLGSLSNKFCKNIIKMAVWERKLSDLDKTADIEEEIKEKNMDICENKKKQLKDNMEKQIANHIQNSIPTLSENTQEIKTFNYQGNAYEEKALVVAKQNLVVAVLIGLVQIALAFVGIN